jgi:cell division septal protein FtsQ
MSQNKSVKKFFFWLLFLAFLAVVFWLLFFSEYTKIEKIEVISSEKIDKNALIDILNKKSEEKWFNFLPKNNFFLFPRKDSSKKIKNDFELIREISFENKFPNQIKVKTNEREDVIILCNQLKCFLMDETGQLFREINFNDKDDRFKNYLVINENSHLDIEEGLKVDITENLIKFIKESVSRIKEELGIEIEREMETPALISEEIRFRTAEGWQIYFNLEESVVEQVDLLKEILNSSLTKEDRENLNYIDLRISNKAIYNSSSQSSPKEDEEE